MIGKLNAHLNFNEAALKLRAHRQEVLASNIANADTPNYKAQDFDFAAALRNATEGGAVGNVQMARTDGRHLESRGAGALSPRLMFRQSSQPSIDGNTVETDVEMAQFSDNAIRYQAQLAFLNGRISSLRQAIQNQ